MNRSELRQKHWRYYLMLERHFVDTLEYVELHSDNFESYSDNYALLVQAVGAELDAVFKLFCGFALSDRKTIADYVVAIDAKESAQSPCEYPIRNQKIEVTEYGITIQPFAGWDTAKPAQSLAWWNAFTSLKHDRYSNRRLANQGNALNILGALFLVEMLLLKDITEGTDELDAFDEVSRLFTLRSWSSKAIPLHRSWEAIADMLEGKNSSSARKYDI